jgi:hypothetical protein
MLRCRTTQPVRASRSRPELPLAKWSPGIAATLVLIHVHFELVFEAAHYGWHFPFHSWLSRAVLCALSGLFGSYGEGFQQPFGQEV